MSAEANEARFSDLFYPGEVPAFIEAFALRLIPNAGRGMTVRELDGKIIVFQEYAVSATYGEGPDYTGANEYPPLQVIARDIGTIHGKSVVTTNEGVFFLSTKGLWLIDRSLSVTCIGAPVEDLASSFVAVAKLTDREQIWFFTATKAIVYDAFHKIWYSHAFTIPAVNISDAKVIGGSLYVVSSGNLFKLTDGTFSDSGQNVGITMRTSWLSMAGLQGVERIRRIAFLCDQNTASTLTVKLRYDFNPTVAETFTISTASIVETGGNVQFTLRPQRQKCECVQIEFSSTSGSAIVDVNNITIEAGSKAGTKRLAASNKIKGS
jgi:hypothetical protein